jgi:prevent-host-death family protein
MQTLPLSEVKNRLSALVADVDSLRDRVVITRNGRAAAVLLSTEEVAELDETAFWATAPGIGESLARADADIRAGRTYSTEEIRAWVGAGMPEQEPQR